MDIAATQKYRFLAYHMMLRDQQCTYDQKLAQNHQKKKHFVQVLPFCRSFVRSSQQLWSSLWSHSFMKNWCYNKRTLPTTILETSVQIHAQIKKFTQVNHSSTIHIIKLYKNHINNDPKPTPPATKVASSIYTYMYSFFRCYIPTINTTFESRKTN